MWTIPDLCLNYIWTILKYICKKMIRTKYRNYTNIWTVYLSYLPELNISEVYLKYRWIVCELYIWTISDLYLTYIWTHLNLPRFSFKSKCEFSRLNFIRNHCFFWIYLSFSRRKSEFKPKYFWTFLQIKKAGLNERANPKPSGPLP